MRRNDNGILERTAIILARMFGLASLSDSMSNASETHHMNDVGLVYVEGSVCDSRCIGCIPCIEYAETQMARYMDEGDYVMARAMMLARDANQTNLERKVYFRTK